jgi:hypothetical protein
MCDNEDDREDKMMQHFAARCRNANAHKHSCGAEKAIHITIDTSQFKDQSDASSSKFVHVGTSPQVSNTNKAQARRQVQSFMSYE